MTFAGQLSERAAGCLLGVGIGDALGFPVENIMDADDLQRIHGTQWITTYLERLTYDHKAAYSDDTQLTLAVARSMRPDGSLWVEHFAYVELPAWCEYASGWGYSSQAAAYNLSGSAAWDDNFYLDNEAGGRAIDYRQAASNGVVMRIAPIAICNLERPEQMWESVFVCAMPTHGHPNSVLSAYIQAELVRQAMVGGTCMQVDEAIAQAAERLRQLKVPELAESWQRRWDEGQPRSYLQEFTAAQQELADQLLAILKLGNRAALEDYLRQIGFQQRDRRTLAAVSLPGTVAHLRLYADDPERLVLELVNRRGCDADSVASFAAALVGAQHGPGCFPTGWREGVQDALYLERVGRELAELAVGRRERAGWPRHPAEQLPSTDEVLRSPRLEEGERVVHPVFGAGTVAAVSDSLWEASPLTGNLYGSRNVWVAFDVGQSVEFTSPIEIDLDDDAAWETDRLSEHQLRWLMEH